MIRPTIPTHETMALDRTAVVLGVGYCLVRDWLLHLPGRR
jgi:hypothetical protein